MKYRLLFTIAFSIISLSLFSQVHSGLKTFEKNPATVLSWDKHVVEFSKNYWDDKKEEQILKQISVEEFEKVKSSSGWQKVPKQMSIWDGQTRKKLKDLTDKLHLLTVYKVAAFDHYYQDKIQGKYVILKVPYEENKTWDTTAVWETVYFVVPEASVK